MQLQAILKKDKWVRPFIKKYFYSLCLSLFLGVMTFFCACALMFCSGYLISKSASLPLTILSVYVPIVLTRAFGIFRPVFNYAESLTSHNWVLKMTSKIRVKLYHLLEKEAVFLKGRYQTGEFLDILSEDINNIQNLYLRTIFPTIVATIIYFIVVCCLGYFSIPLALLVLLEFAFTLFVIPMYALLWKAAKREKEREYQNQLYNDLTDNVLGVNDWIISGRKLEYLKHHEKIEKQRADVRKLMTKKSRNLNFLNQMIFAIILLTVLFYTTKLFQNNLAMVNYIAAFVLTIFPLIDVFSPVTDAVEGFNIHKASLKRLNELDKDVSVSKETVNNKELMSEVLASATYEIKVENVSFDYDNQPILQDINFEIYSKEKVALLGKSGVGKSTLISLIRGDLKPKSGQVLLNNQKTEIFGDEITKYISIIQQDNYLFNTTILNNIRLGNEEATEEEVWDVLNQVGLKERIEKLPKGIYTQISEAGFGFSGGEQQRLGLARSLISHVPIIILDEPTVGLDPVTERQVLNLFFDKLQDKTVFWITHHLQGIKKADRILFLDKGHLVMNDTYSNLLIKNAHFQKLVAFEKP